MLITLHRRLAAARREDGGWVLPSVIGLVVVMLILSAAALGSVSTGEVRSNSDQNWEASLAAAYAGVADYQNRITTDPTYYRYGNPGAAFSASSASMLTLPTGAAVNPAFNIAAGQPWANVPGSTVGAQYRYEVDISQYSSTGVLRIRSTGKVNNSVRTVIANVKQKGFLNYVYFTNLETQDPAMSSNPLTCNAYYGTRPTTPTCSEIVFISSDVINGAVHSNDRITVCGSPTFLKQVTTAWVSGTTKTYGVGQSCGDTPNWSGYGQPKVVSQAPMPPTNSSMKADSRADLNTINPGCLYTGPTTVTMNANGTLTVYSPWTKYTNPSLTSGISSQNPSQCGTPGTGTGQLGSTSGATLTIASNTHLSGNMIYVQNVPTSTADPNYWGAAVPSGFTCTNPNTSTAGWKFGSFQYPYKSGATTESTPQFSTNTNPAYNCTSGDLYTSGTLNGVLTMASENYIYATGNIVYSDASKDVLGMVGQNAVLVWDPMNNQNAMLTGANWQTTDDNGNTVSGRRIDAAILSVAHTFAVQNYQYGGNRGTLYVLGSIAQYYRGTVGYGTNGFSKAYSYDSRFLSVSPPKFLNPTTVQFGTTQTIASAAAFTADGTPR